jgi:transforming growth factor-beta-induced protein
MRFVSAGWILLICLALTACEDSFKADTEEVAVSLPVYTILDIATQNGGFETLLTAVDAAGLTSTIDDENAELTLFAPTDAAFALLGEELLNDLINDPETLSDILLYHVVSGSVIDSTAAAGAAGTTVEMANGDKVGISAKGDALMINLAKVTATDIEADNGIIHVIDAVLIPPADSVPSESTIVNIAAADEQFSTLVAALQATGLDTVLADETETFTVFAPTNAAFEAMGTANVEALLNDLDNLAAILQQHVIAGIAVDAVTAYSLSGAAAETVGGAEVPVSITSRRELRIGGAKVVVADILAANGVIHVIDTVIVGEAGLPRPSLNIAEVATAAGSFNTLLAAVTAADLGAALTDPESSFTVFAPTDEAFEKLGAETINALLADPATLANILLYHVFEGEVLADTALGVAASDASILTMANATVTQLGDRAALSLGTSDQLTVNLAQVVAANVMASNGVIHVIDNVMLPPAAMGEVTSNLADTAIAAGSFTTLVSALETAGLVDALSDPDAELTVFAPTDAAFDAIDPTDLSVLLADSEALTALLTSHVISGQKVDSVTAYALNGTSVETLSGEDVALTIEDGALLVQGSRVTATDIFATNGIIHVIDQVIGLPGGGE